MNPFVKKEIRLLLPNFIFAAVLAFLGVFFHDAPDTWAGGIGYFLGCVFFPAVVVMLTLNTFGVEVGTHTFPMMLAQPVSRQRIWDTKIFLLALALVALGVLWVVLVALPALFFQHALIGEKLGDVFAAAILFGLAVYTGGIWTVLLLRQVAAAFWFTLIVPGALAAIVAGLCGGATDRFILGMLATVLGLYSLAGFFFARWLFFRAQDLQWTGGAIVFPEWRGAARRQAAVGRLRVWRPRAALWWKEILLHQSQYVIAFVLLVLHLGVLAIRTFCNLEGSRDLKFVLENFMGLWLVMPLLVGSAAVAEERKMGTLENQLCLPAKRRGQFAIKLLTVVGLSILLGAIMPLLIEGSRILPDDRFKLGQPFNGGHLYFWMGVEALNDLLPFLTFAGIVLLIGLVSFYVSTMARNILQTLAPAVLGISVAFSLIMVLAAPLNQVHDFFWSGPLGYLIVPPLLGLALLMLAFRNFQSVLTGWRMVTRNLLALVSVLALAVVITSAVYHRCWEKFTAFEPSHGPAQLSLANPATLSSDFGELVVQLPNGSMWMAPVLPDLASRDLRNVLLGRFQMKTAAGNYFAGTNWASFTSSYWVASGLKSDGTLWVSEFPKGAGAEQHDGNSHNPIQIGTETNWTSSLPAGRSVLLTKRDGTLWRLGPVDFDVRHRSWPGLASFTPEQVGTGSNWAEVFQIGYQIAFRKTDGTGWMTGEWNSNNVASAEIGQGLVVCRVPGLDHGRMRSTALISHGLDSWVGVRTDGTFRIWAGQRLNQTTRFGTYEWQPDDVQIGSDTNWVAVTGDWQRAITLKNDGTLWLWDFRLRSTREWLPEKFEQDIAKTVPVRLGTHSDWIAISGASALAADGSVWFWPLGNINEVIASSAGPYYGGDNVPWLPLLDISRKPQLLGNIFNPAN